MAKSTLPAYIANPELAKKLNFVRVDETDLDLHNYYRISQLLKTLRRDYDELIIHNWIMTGVLCYSIKEDSLYLLCTNAKNEKDVFKELVADRHQSKRKLDAREFELRKLVSELKGYYKLGRDEDYKVIFLNYQQEVTHVPLNLDQFNKEKLLINLRQAQLTLDNSDISSKLGKLESQLRLSYNLKKFLDTDELVLDKVWSTDTETTYKLFPGRNTYARKQFTKYKTGDYMYNLSAKNFEDYFNLIERILEFNYNMKAKPESEPVIPYGEFDEDEDQSSWSDSLSD